uniref:Uncharacterized protein n=1 Tax=Steinernema glaseri TaxID=37863 RepID=A0A1I8A0T7_9BILA
MTHLESWTSFSSSAFWRWKTCSMMARSSALRCDRSGIIGSAMAVAPIRPVVGGSEAAAALYSFGGSEASVAAAGGDDDEEEGLEGVAGLHHHHQFQQQRQLNSAQLFHFGERARERLVSRFHIAGLATRSRRPARSVARECSCGAQCRTINDFSCVDQQFLGILGLDTRLDLAMENDASIDLCPGRELGSAKCLTCSPKLWEISAKILDFRSENKSPKI